MTVFPKMTSARVVKKAERRKVVADDDEERPEHNEESGQMISAHRGKLLRDFTRLPVSAPWPAPELRGKWFNHWQQARCPLLLRSD